MCHDSSNANRIRVGWTACGVYRLSGFAGAGRSGHALPGSAWSSSRGGSGSSRTTGGTWEDGRDGATTNFKHLADLK